MYRISCSSSSLYWKLYAPKPDLILTDMDEYVVSDTVTSVPAVATNKAKTSKSKPKYVSEPLIEDWISDNVDENETETKSKQRKPSFAKGNLQQDLQEKGVINSRCSRHMTGNMSYLSEYEEIDGGYVAFGGDPKSGKINGKGKISTCKLDFKDVYFVKELKFNLFSVSQMCAKKNSVLFTYTEYVVLSPDFMLTDENHVLLKVPRNDNMYNVDLKNAVPQEGLTYLFANATLDESNLWHRRIGHISFKTMNKLVRGNIVRGLPSKVFENDHTCVACQKGKQHKSSCKTKSVSLISQPLQILHMDLFGPTFVKSLMKKMYCLVVTDDFSRFSWVFFLATKDETSGILKAFITRTENLIDYTVKIIRCDNETEFKNKEMNLFCEKQDHLGNFDGKADEGFSVGYSVNSKAFRVFKSRTRIVEETLHITFLENKPNVAGNQSNGSAGKARVEIVPDKDYILLPLWTQDPLFSSSSKDSLGDGFKPSREEEKKDAEDPGNEDNKVLSIKELRVNQVKDANVNSTNNINTVSPTANAAGIKDNVVDKNIVYGCDDDPNMPNLEEIVYSDDDEDVGSKADMTNLDTNILMDVKSAVLYGKIEKEVYVCQHIGLEDPEFPNSVYKVEKALYGLHQAPKACQDKYVDEILKKFGFPTMKTASTPMETSKPLMKEKNAEDVDVHLYRSMIDSLMYLTSSRPDIMFVVCACARFQVTPKVHIFML
nr:putative ribonuclease H-like domain-containing protein [Tanacetum cinerariifolium]